VLIRELDPGEEELCRILGRFVVESYVTLPGHVPEPEYEDELADVAGRAGLPDTAVLVAFDDDGTPLGCATYVAGPASPMAEHQEDGVASMRMLGVDPAAQGRGAGRALVEECLRRARAAGCRGLAFHTTPWMTKAHTLYESLGFERDDTMTWSPAEGIDLLGYRLTF
jgi:ribosomal protein S18 acetylase RimI-like enzyme